LVLGVNIGKNKDTPLEAAAEDYISLLRSFAPLADYLAINVSSPNTAGLRRLQGREMLEGLLGSLANERQRLLDQARRPGSLPILVKLAPDLTAEELEDALGAILQTGMDGVIATNTTLARPNLRAAHATETGGLSGSPLTVPSRAFVAEVLRRTQGRLPVIGVGGIMNAADARAMMDAGACCVQVYTGMIYAGPGLPQAILRGLSSTAQK
jgi:dihydroorotate dehydrogenase